MRQMDMVEVEPSKLVILATMTIGSLIGNCMAPVLTLSQMMFERLQHICIRLSSLLLSTLYLFF